MSLATFALALAAVARITRFITSDLLAEPFREWVEKRWPGSRHAYLVTCDWCASIWVAAAVTPTAYALGDTLWFQAPAVALALSYLYAIAAQNLDREA